MSTKSILTLASAALLALTACIVPPSMFERASWGPPPEYWQEQGRYRPAGDDVATGAAGNPLVAEGESAQPAPADRTVIGGGGENSGVENSDVGNDALARGRGVDPAAPAAPLYAWDGGVVDGAPQGRVTPESGSPRGLEAPSAGRTHIIELYQQVLDERDALAQEVELLRASLEQTRFALDTKSNEGADLSARLAALEATHAELVAENQALAARLVQAQIRRLEAEKLLLETRIEQERARTEAARAAAAQKPGGKSKPAPKSGSDQE